MPLTCASVMKNKITTLQTNDAMDPSATRVSMLGALCQRLLNPLTKNLPFTTMITADNSSCTKPIAIGLRASHPGSGQPHMVCPMDIYMSTTSKTADTTSLFTSTGVSWSANSSFAAAFTSVPLGDAPYPAFSTASIIAASLALPSTPMAPVSRFTEHEVTPSTLETAFSTRELQAAQLMPVTLYCFIYYLRTYIICKIARRYHDFYRRDYLPTYLVGFMISHLFAFVNSFFINFDTNIVFSLL